MPTATDWIGRRLGKLVVVELLGYAGGHGVRRYRCKCDCGNSIDVLTTQLYGRVTCCGCSRPRRRRKHGGYLRPEYRIWKAMWRRCRNPRVRSYRNYGGRGIKVCDRWKSFAAFFADMGERPSPKHSIDRINNDGDYEPGNCKWSTMKEQLANRRVSRQSA